MEAFDFDVSVNTDCEVVLGSFFISLTGTSKHRHLKAIRASVFISSDSLNVISH